MLGEYINGTFDVHNDISCDTQVFAYVFVHVMCLCVYVSMICQQCMLYDDMYSHDTNVKKPTKLVQSCYNMNL
jgi:hypothetical protein